MITCSYCNNEELTGALFCSKCGSQLVYPGSGTTNVIESDEIGRYEDDNVPSFPDPPADAADSIVALRLLDENVTFHIPGREVYTLGRSTKGQTIIPDIDLNPYNAYEAGVSRLHANINIKGPEVTVQDLGSANGTHLNGRNIPPHTDHLLKHGDILLFGKLKIQILIRE